MIIKIAEKQSLFLRTAAYFGAPHKQAYDWRDDHLANTSFQRDPRLEGIKPPQQYTFPYTAPPLDHILSHPPDYDQKNLNVNYIGTNPSRKILFNAKQLPHIDWMADIAHEFDYQSQDLDLQPQSFKTQHFRKKGMVWMWVISAFTPLWFFAWEMFYTGFDDEDNYRYQRPPPLDYPDIIDTDDTQTVQQFKTPQFQHLYYAGLVTQPFMEIVDGRKIYSKWAGVNEPGIEI